MAHTIVLTVLLLLSLSPTNLDLELAREIMFACTPFLLALLPKKVAFLAKKIG